MSKKSNKLVEISKMFDEIDVDLDNLSKEGITDMITIIKKQNDSRYQPNVKHKMEDIILITLFAGWLNVMNGLKLNHLLRKRNNG